MGIAMQELLAFRGIESDHIAIRTSSYHAIDQQESTVQVYSLSYLVKKISNEDRLLIVDDVYDTGRSIDTIIKRLEQLTRRNMPHDVRVAVPYYKPTRNQTDPSEVKPLQKLIFLSTFRLTLRSVCTCHKFVD